MKFRMLLAIVVAGALAALLSGCGSAQKYWYSPQKDSAALKLDFFQCEEEAAAYSRNMGVAGKQKVVDERLAQCMELRGYKAVPEKELPKGSPRLR